MDSSRASPPRYSDSEIPDRVSTSSSSSTSSTSVRAKRAYMQDWHSQYPPYRATNHPVVLLSSNDAHIWLKNGQEWVLDKESKYFLQFHFPHTSPETVPPPDYNTTTTTQHHGYNTTSSTHFSHSQSHPHSGEERGEESFARKRKRALSGSSALMADQDLHAAAAQLSMLSSSPAPTTPATTTPDKVEEASVLLSLSASGEPSAKKARTTATSKTTSSTTHTSETPIAKTSDVMREGAEILASVKEVEILPKKEKPDSGTTSPLESTKKDEERGKSKAVAESDRTKAPQADDIIFIGKDEESEEEEESNSDSSEEEERYPHRKEVLSPS